MGRDEMGMRSEMTAVVTGRAIAGRRLGSRDAARGVVSGLVGGLCCVAGAIAAGLGLGGVDFFATLMGRYQVYFVAASVLVMAAWLARSLRRGERGGGRGAAARRLARPAIVMAAMWALTLAVAMAASRLAGVG